MMLQNFHLHEKTNILSLQKIVYKQKDIVLLNVKLWSWDPACVGKLSKQSKEFNNSIMKSVIQLVE